MTDLARQEAEEDAETMGLPVLPPACPRPCGECPWRRESLAGWLGPMTAEEWATVAHGEEPIACHVTIRETDETGHGSWEHPAIRQCAGAAVFRSNVCKLPHNPTDATRTTSADRTTVFGRTDEFLAHHQTPRSARG